MNRSKALLVVCCLMLLTGICSAYPKPAAVPAIGDWTLDVVYEHPRQITVKLPGEDQPKRFWYVILSLTNNSPLSEVPFYPASNIVTDNFKTVEAGKGVRQGVFELIKKRHQGKYPFITSLDKMDKKILHGQDNSVDVVVIFPDFDAKAKNVTFMLSGLSNETIAINHPIKADKIFLRKTLALKYASGGDETLRAASQLAFNKKTWVLR